jgi:hypothetical protein
MDYTLTSAQYRQYVRNEKKLFWPRKWTNLGNDDHTNQQRIDQKILILWGLLYDNFWMTLQIDAAWIDSIQQFLYLTGTSLEPYAGQFAPRQIRWEKEIANLWDTTGDKNTAFAKQVVALYLHNLQKTALKQLSTEDRQKVLQLSSVLR